MIVAAGDVAAPSPSAATRATATLITAIDPDMVIALGDNQYPSGALSDFKTGYGATWGALRSRTRPTPGNHEYESDPTAAGFFTYFRHEVPSDYYSYDLGEWHMISLNSNCEMTGGCSRGSAQFEWLRDDLARHDSVCTLAYWHHPRWTSGVTEGNSEQVAPFVRLLEAANADVILTAHEHNYERFAPQSADGRADPAGIVQFVVGTGGKSLMRLGPPDDNSVARSDTTFGVLQMTLHPDSYDFSFKPVLDGAFQDSGSKTCH